MVSEDRFASLHQVAEQLAAGAGREMIDSRLFGDSVRWLGLRRRGERRGSAMHEDVAIADAGMEFEAIAAELRLNGLDERAAVLVGDVAGGEVAHQAVFDGDEIAPNGPVVR